MIQAANLGNAKVPERISDKIVVEKLYHQRLYNRLRQNNARIGRACIFSRSDHGNLDKK